MFLKRKKSKSSACTETSKEIDKIERYRVEDTDTFTQK